MYSPKLALLLCTFAITANCAQISAARNELSMQQKRKTFCSMMSYHFLDYDTDTFKAFTQNFSQLRIDLFKAKVASKLSENCQHKITNQQLHELAQLVERPKGHEQQIESLEEKYIEYFTPDQNIILKLLKQVQQESETQMQNQIRKYNQTRTQIEHFASQVASGFMELSSHIKNTAHHTVDKVSKFLESTLDLQGNVSVGLNDFRQKLGSNIQDLKGNLSEGMEKLNSHPHVKKLKDLWNSVWSEDL